MNPKEKVVYSELFGVNGMVFLGLLRPCQKYFIYVEPTGTQIWMKTAAPKHKKAKMALNRSPQFIGAIIIF